MEWTNYNHLFYFWTVARHSSVIRASEELLVAQPTVTEQIRTLEQSLGVKLVERVGRGLRLSDDGEVLFAYADKMFRLGREMRDVIAGRTTSVQLRLTVGIAQSLPKLVAYQLIAPALKHSSVRLLCIEDRPEQLFSRLALHRLDLVLSDGPIPPSVNVRAYSHRLAHCGVSFMASRKPSHERFPRCLDRVPFLMPEPNSPLYNSLESWFAKHGIWPTIVGEFSDSALLKIFGQEGVGAFAVPTIAERDVATRYKVKVLGRTTEITEEFYAITTDRRVTHPAITRIFEAAPAAKH